MFLRRRPYGRVLAFVDNLRMSLFQGQAELPFVTIQCRIKIRYSNCNPLLGQTVSESILQLEIIVARTAQIGQDS